jgi:hypothetical protein
MERKRLGLLFVEDAVADFELYVRELERGHLDVSAERVTTREEYEECLIRTQRICDVCDAR